MMPSVHAFLQVYWQRLLRAFHALHPQDTSSPALLRQAYSRPVQKLVVVAAV
jgi:hypothetical protein